MVRLYIINAGSEQAADWAGEMWMHPSANVRQPKPVGSVLPPPLVATYEDAIESYQQGMWRAAAQHARVVLEGVVKHRLAQIDGSPVDPRTQLARLLDQLREKMDLAKPITDVSEVMREGGNIASHFDEAKPVSPELAAEMLDLLDAFLDYLVLLPLMVERLRARLEAAP